MQVAIREKSKKQRNHNVSLRLCTISVVSFPNLVIALLPPASLRSPSPSRLGKKKKNKKKGTKAHLEINVALCDKPVNNVELIHVSVAFKLLANAGADLGHALGH